MRQPCVELKTDCDHLRKLQERNKTLDGLFYIDRNKQEQYYLQKMMAYRVYKDRINGREDKQLVLPKP